MSTDHTDPHKALRMVLNAYDAKIITLTFFLEAKV